MNKDKITKLTESKEKLLEMEKYFQVVPEHMDFKAAIDIAVASLEEDIAEEQKMYDYYLRTGDEAKKVFLTKKGLKIIMNVFTKHGITHKFFSSDIVEFAESSTEEDTDE